MYHSIRLCWEWSFVRGMAEREAVGGDHTKVEQRIPCKSEVID